MKQGSTDDPFADDDDTESTEDDEISSDVLSVDENSSESNGENGLETEEAASGQSHAGPEHSSGVPEQRSLPYIHARDGVKDGRTQRPVFLRDDIEAGIDELLSQMEAEFGEDVYKTDITEAAMAVAQANPDLVRAKLEEWGYGWT